MNGKGLLIKMFRSKRNAFWNNVADMVDREDMNGLEQVARNLCQSNNVRPDDALRSAKTMFGQK